MIRTLAIAALALGTTLASQAAPFSHPAVATAGPSIGIDANTFLVQPPASATWTVLASSKPAHANFDHPAVAVGRLSQHAGIDANTFLVQPPASVTWTVQPASKPAHVNFDHPAVAVGRLSQHAGIDTNTFLVQPPASVSWTVPVSDKLLAAASPALVK